MIWLNFLIGFGLGAGVTVAVLVIYSALIAAKRADQAMGYDDDLPPTLRPPVDAPAHRQPSRRRFFTALAAAPLLLVTHEQTPPDTCEAVTRHAVAFHTEVLMDHENRIARLEGRGDGRHSQELYAGGPARHTHTLVG